MASQDPKNKSRLITILLVSLALLLLFVLILRSCQQTPMRYSQSLTAPAETRIAVTTPWHRHAVATSVLPGELLS